MSIFSDRDEAEVIKHLAGGEAQAFVDAIDEASDCTFRRSKRVGQIPLICLPCWSGSGKLA